MPKTTVIKISKENAVKVENFRQSLLQQASFSINRRWRRTVTMGKRRRRIKRKVKPLSLSFMSFSHRRALSVTDRDILVGPVITPISILSFSSTATCGYIQVNVEVVGLEVVGLLDRVKPEIRTLKETCILAFYRARRCRDQSL
ncbi:hypothetical protein AAFF_G00026750 [Aldrovandia affinis]|uniref:Uncharacterized protein n=1 Tax=Aldrovandia affinis TaxID=143900 RepID=A0AAD7WGC1_9TELE|nr:hypothetical protein AAFF_G00026750 [Aldrovandia affinis]